MREVMRSVPPAEAGSPTGSRDAGDSVSIDFLEGDFFESDNTRAERSVRFDQLFRRRFAAEDGVAQKAQKRLVFQVISRLVDGIAQSLLVGLIDRMDADLRDDLVDARQQRFLPAGPKPRFQLFVWTEVILDRLLAFAGHQQHVIDSGGGGFFDDVLNRRLVENRQQLLRDSLGGGQHPRPETRGGDDGFRDCHLSFVIGH